MKIKLKFNVNEIGLAVECESEGKWQLLELFNFKEHSRPGFGKTNSVFISPARQIEELKDVYSRIAKEKGFEISFCNL